MTVAELIAELQKYPPESEVCIRSENDECDVCSNLKHEKCSLAGEFIWPFIKVSNVKQQVLLDGF